MYIDLMSPYYSLNINLKLAQMFTLNCAVYWAELMDIYARVIKKKKNEIIESQGFFDLDRKYVENRTTLSLKDQLTCDEILKKIDVLTADEIDSSKIKLDVEKMFAVLLEDDPKVIKQLQKQTKVKRVEASELKRKMILENMLSYVDSNDVDIKEAMRIWIQALLDGNKFVNSNCVTVFQKYLNDYTDRKDIKLKLLEIAAVHCWNDFGWVKNDYERNYARTMGISPSINQPAKKVDFNSGF